MNIDERFIYVIIQEEAMSGIIATKIQQ